MIFGTIRKHLAKVLHDLGGQRGALIVGKTLMLDHIHVYLSKLPKYPVLYAINYIKRKSAISIACRLMGKAKNFTCKKF